MDDKAQDLLSYIGWLTGGRLFNGSDLYIPYIEIYRLYTLENSIMGKDKLENDEMKKIVNQFVREKKLLFKKDDNNQISLKLNI